MLDNNNGTSSLNAVSVNRQNPLTVEVKEGAVIPPQPAGTATDYKLGFSRELVAKMGRQGNDLILFLTDGRTVRLQDFYLNTINNSLVFEGAAGGAGLGGGLLAGLGGLAGLGLAAASGGLGGSSSSGGSSTVINDNAPIPSSSGAVIVEDSTILSGRIVATDKETAASNLVFSTSSNAPGLTFAADGSYSFDPTVPTYDHIPAGQTIVVVVPFTVTDESGNSGSGNLRITVTGTNDAPVVQADVDGVAQGGTVAGQLGSNDSDVDDGTVLTYTLVDSSAGPASKAAHGGAQSAGAGVTVVPGLVFRSDGSYTYDSSVDPSNKALAAGQSRQILVEYSVSDGVVSVTSTLVITVTGTNDAPIAQAGSLNLAEDSGATTGTLVGTDVDNNDTLTFTATAPAHGTVVITDAATGAYTYTPNANYSGNDSFTYTVKDAAGASSTATVSILVTPTNDAPISRSSVATTREDTDLLGQLPTATDPEGDSPLTYAVGAAPTHGTVDIGADGSYVYTPDADYSGSDSFTFTVADPSSATSTAYTINITVKPVNDAPLGVDAVASATEDGAALTGTLTATDSDTVAASLIFSTSSSAAGFALNADGSYTFDPTNAAYQSLAAGAKQVLVIPFTVTDDKGLSDAAQLTITVTGTNDAPVAVADVNSVSEDGVVTGSVATNDSDIDTGATLTYAVTGTAPTGLTLQPNGSYTYNAALDSANNALATGQTRDVVVNYTVNDGSGPVASTLTITVTGASDAPLGNDAVKTATEDGTSLTGTLTATDTDTAVGNLVFTTSATPAGFALNADGSYSFDPSVSAYQSLAAGAKQVLVIPFTVTDDTGLSDAAQLTITVTGTNDAPVAVADVNSVSEDGSITGSVATNDSDVDTGATLTYAVTGTAPTGLTFQPNGSYSYNAALDAANDALGANQTRDVVVNYTVNDGTGVVSSTLTITVTGVNDAPLGMDAAKTATEDGTALTGTLAATDPDTAAASLIFTTTATPAGFTLNADGSYSFDPSVSAYQSLAAGAKQVLVIPFTVTDDKGLSDAAQLTITVTGTNDVPKAVADVNSVTEDGSITGSVATNDSDVDTGATLTYAITGTAPTGLTFQPNGSYSYNAALDATNNALGANATRDIVVNYTVNDGSGPVASTLTITVTGINDAPVTSNSALVVTENSAAISGNLPAVTDDVAGYSYSLSAPAAHGTVIITNAATGAYSYQPDAGYKGSDSFTFLVTDAGGLTTTGSIAITVQNVNDLPVAANGSIAASQNAIYTGALPGATDADGDVITYALGTAPAHGTVNITNAATGAFTFTPAAGFSGTDSFTYSVKDPSGGSNTYTMNVVVNDPAPQITIDQVAGDNVVNAAEAAATAVATITGTVTGGYTVGDAIALTINGTAAKGTAPTVQAGGFWSYTMVAGDGPLFSSAISTVGATVSHVNAAGATVTASDTQSVTVDKVGPAVTLSVDQIAGDNVLTRAESQQGNSISGTVSGAKAGDVIQFTLNDGTSSSTLAYTLTATDVTNGSYTLNNVPGSLLKVDADTTVSATITSSDAAGNSATATATGAYTVNLSTPTILITSPLTTSGDNILNATENAAGDIAIAGTTTGTKAGDEVTVKVNGVDHKVTLAADNGGYSVNVLMADFRADSKVSASVTSHGETATTQNGYAVDLSAPTVAISVESGPAAGGNLAIGQQVTLAFVFSEAPVGFTASDITLSTGGSVTNFSGGGTRYTATYTVPAGLNINDPISITVGDAKFTDAAGNVNLDGSDTNNRIDFVVAKETPTVALNGYDAFLLGGETTSVVINLSHTPEASNLFTFADVLVNGVAMSAATVTDAKGTFTFAPTADPLVFQLAYVPATGFEGSATVAVPNSAFDAIVTGTAATTNTDGADANNAATIVVDTTNPSVSIVIAEAPGKLSLGEKTQVQFTLAEASNDFALTSVAPPQFGALSNFTKVSPTYYTADYTPTAGAQGTETITVAANSFSDRSGNRNGAAASASIVIDQELPTISVSVDTTSLIAGQTSQVTFTLSEAASDFIASDVTVTGGALSAFTAVSSTVYTATFTPTTNAEGSPTIRVDSDRFTDAAGNKNADGADANNLVTLTADTRAPSVSISSSDSSLTVGETATITFTLSEASKTFTSGDVTVTAGAGSLSGFAPVTSSGSAAAGYTQYTALFTPSLNSTAAATISVAGATFADVAGNNNTAAASVVLNVDTAAPQVNMVINAISAVTATEPADRIILAEASSNITVTGKVEGLVTGDFATVTLTVGIGAGATTYPGISVAADGTWSQQVAGSTLTASATPEIKAVASVVDTSGNTGSAQAVRPYTVDITPPTVAISVETGPAAGGNVSIGQQVTLAFDFSEAPTGFDASDITLSTGGVVTNFAGSGTRYTATYTVPAGLNIADRVSVSVGDAKFADASGNTNQDGSDTNNRISFVVAKEAPTVALSSSDSFLLSGETSVVTINLSHAPVASNLFTFADVAVDGVAMSGASVTNAKGTFTFAATADAKVFQVTYVPAFGLQGSVAISVPNSAFDAIVTGASATTNIDGFDTNNTTTIGVDTSNPNVTVVIAEAPGKLSLGEKTQVQFTLSEASSDFALTSVAPPQFGTLSNFTKVSPTYYTADYTPNSGAQGTETIRVAANSFHDLAGNTNSIAGLATIIIDQELPTIAVSVNATSLIAGGVSNVTFTLSEASTDFTASDVTVTGGALSAFTAVSSTVYTAIFTPTTNAEGAPTIRVDSDRFTDLAGNANGDGADANNLVTLAADTRIPSISISSSDSSLTVGESATITFTLSEPSKTFTSGDVTVTAGAGSLSGFAPVSSSGSDAAGYTQYTATFTPALNSTAAATIAVAASTFSDIAGNNNTGTASVVLNVDTAAPLVSMTINPITAITATEPADRIILVESTSNVTVTGKVNGLIAGDFATVALTVGTGAGAVTYSGISVASDGTWSQQVAGTTLTGSATPEIKAVASVVDTSGNTGSAQAIRPYTVDISAPTVSIVLDDISDPTPDGNQADDILTLNETGAGVKQAITGTVSGEFVAGDTVKLYIDDQIYTTTIDNAGNFYKLVDGAKLLSDPDSKVIAIVDTKDANGNTGTATSGATDGKYQIDVSAPSVQSLDIVSAPTHGIDSKTYYGAGDKIRVAVKFDQIIVVDGVPTMTLSLSGGTQNGVTAAPKTVNALFESTSGDTVTFAYTVQVGDLDHFPDRVAPDSNGVQVVANSLTVTGGTIRDVNGNDAVLTHAAYNNGTTMLDADKHFVDAIAPQATLTWGSSGDLVAFANRNTATALQRNQSALEIAYQTAASDEIGIYKLGDAVYATLSFGEGVIVDTSGGSPTLTMAIDAGYPGNVYSKNVSMTLDMTFSDLANGLMVFKYIVTNTDQDTLILDQNNAVLADFNGAQIKAGALQPNGAKITDLAGNAFEVSSVNVLTEASGDRHQYIDGIAPTVDGRLSGVTDGATLTTENRRPAFAGTGEAGALVTVHLPTTTPGVYVDQSVRVQADGTWTLTPGQDLPYGTLPGVLVTITDLAGNTSTDTVTGLDIVSINPNTNTIIEAGGRSTDTNYAPQAPSTGNVFQNDRSAATGADFGDNLTVTAFSSQFTSASGVVNGTTQLQGHYGKLTMAADGSYSYSLDPAFDSQLDSLHDATQTFTETFNYSAKGQTDTLTITIKGSNDAPVVTRTDMIIPSNKTTLLHFDGTAGGYLDSKWTALTTGTGGVANSYISYGGLPLDPNTSGNFVGTNETGVVYAGFDQTADAANAFVTQTTATFRVYQGQTISLTSDIMSMLTYPWAPTYNQNVEVYWALVNAAGVEVQKIGETYTTTSGNGAFSTDAVKLVDSAWNKTAATTVVNQTGDYKLALHWKNNANTVWVYSYNIAVDRVGLNISSPWAATAAEVFAAMGVTDVDTGASIKGYAITRADDYGTTAKWMFSTDGGATFEAFNNSTNPIDAAHSVFLKPTDLIIWTGNTGMNTTLTGVVVDDSGTATFSSSTDSSVFDRINVTTRGGNTAYSQEAGSLTFANVAPTWTSTTLEAPLTTIAQQWADNKGDQSQYPWVATSTGSTYLRQNNGYMNTPSESPLTGGLYQGTNPVGSVLSPQSTGASVANYVLWNSAGVSNLVVTTTASSFDLVTGSKYNFAADLASWLTINAYLTAGYYNPWATARFAFVNSSNTVVSYITNSFLTPLTTLTQSGGATSNANGNGNTNGSQTNTRPTGSTVTTLGNGIWDTYEISGTFTQAAGSYKIGIVYSNQVTTNSSVLAIGIGVDRVAFNTSYNWPTSVGVLVGAGEAKDSDSGNQISGYAITSAASSSDGTYGWQYSKDGGTTWLSLATASTSQAFFLQSKDLIRWTGSVAAPGTQTQIKVVAVDNTIDLTATPYYTKINVTTRGGTTPYSATEAVLAANSTPIVLDLDGDGKAHTSVITTDMHHTGELTVTGWVGANDGMLVWDKFHDGKVHDTSQFEFAQYGLGYSDLQGLSTFDSNGDKVLDAQDAIFADLRVWQDSNQDGISDPGELHGLMDFGITSINLDGLSNEKDLSGNVRQLGLTDATTADGGLMTVFDTSFKYLDAHNWVDAHKTGDKLSLDDNTTLDASNLHGLVQGVAQIDLGAGSTLTLSLADVLDMSKADHQPLVVSGDADSKLDIDLSTWTNTGTVQEIDHAMFSLYETQDMATKLLVEHTITVS